MRENGTLRYLKNKKNFIIFYIIIILASYDLRYISPRSTDFLTETLEMVPSNIMTIMGDYCLTVLVYLKRKKKEWHIAQIIQQLKKKMVVGMYNKEKIEAGLQGNVITYWKKKDFPAKTSMLCTKNMYQATVFL